MNPEDALRQAVNRFVARFQYVEQQAARWTRAVGELSFDEMNRLWEEASSGRRRRERGDNGSKEGRYQEGKRAGLHPLVVVFGVLLGLWLFVALIVAQLAQQTGDRHRRTGGPCHRGSRSRSVIFRSTRRFPI